MSKQFALIKAGNFFVENTIVAQDDYKLDGYYLVEIGEENPAPPGAYYNPDDGKFYGDAAYKTECDSFKMSL